MAAPTEEEVQDSRHAYSADEQSKPPEPLAVASVWSPPQTHAEAKGLRSLRPGVGGGEAARKKRSGSSPVAVTASASVAK